VLRDCGGINSTGVTVRLILIYVVHSYRCNTSTDFMQVGNSAWFVSLWSCDMSYWVIVIRYKTGGMSRNAALQRLRLNGQDEVTSVSDIIYKSICRLI
jgi:hypothetical protein